MEIERKIEIKIDEMMGRLENLRERLEGLDRRILKLENLEHRVSEHDSLLNNLLAWNNRLVGGLVVVNIILVFLINLLLKKL